MHFRAWCDLFVHHPFEQDVTEAYGLETKEAEQVQISKSLGWFGGTNIVQIER